MVYGVGIVLPGCPAEGWPACVVPGCWHWHGSRRGLTPSQTFRLRRSVSIYLWHALLMKIGIASRVFAFDVRRGIGGGTRPGGDTCSALRKT